MTTLKKYWWIGLILIVIGFFLGRWQTEPKITVKYVKGETATNTVYIDKPYSVEIPAKPLLPLIPDTIKLPGKPEFIYLKVDTAAIIADYIKLNKYSKTMFDDINGKMVVGAEVQYNKLNKLDYFFTPMEKQTTIIKQRLFIPFVMASYNTFGYGGVGGGVYYFNVAPTVKYLSNLKSSGWEFGLQYKF